MSKKILVSGSLGFIGSHICDRLINEGNEVTILDNLDYQVHGGKVPKYLNPKAKFICGDCKDRKTFETAIGDNEVIFHEASAVGVTQSQYEVKYYMDNNIGGTANMLDILANGKHNVKKVIVATSCASYGEGLYQCNSCGTKFKGELRTEEQTKKKNWNVPCACGSYDTKPMPVPETTAQNSTSIYALTKKVQEDAVHIIGKTYGIPSVSLRYFNVFGARQSITNPYTGVMALFMNRIKNGNSPVVYEDGGQTRDFISVHDIVEANVLAMKSSSADYQAFNVGSGEVMSIKSVALMLASKLGKKVRPTISGTWRKGDVRNCYADISKIKSRLGFEPKNFSKTLKEMIEWGKKEESVYKFDKATAEMKAKGLA